MKLLFSFVSFTLLTLNSSALEITTHTAGEAGFLVNSHLISGEKTAILVDAQFLRSEATKVVDLVKKSGKELTTILITHAHPDHYLGLEVLTKEFPSAKVIATPEVIKDIQATAQKKIDYWKTIYKDDLADVFVTPEPFKGNSLTLDNEKITVKSLAPQESEHSVVVYVPSQKALIGGDILYNKVHLWLQEDRPEQWLTVLKDVKKVGKIEKTFPGHGENSDVALIETNSKYIKEYLKATGPKATRESALAKMKDLYPDYRLPVILELSVGARIKQAE